jgi:hypothetical protein
MHVPSLSRGCEIAQFLHIDDVYVQLNFESQDDDSMHAKRSVAANVMSTLRLRFNALQQTKCTMTRRDSQHSTARCQSTQGSVQPTKQTSGPVSAVLKRRECEPC